MRPFRSLSARLTVQFALLFAAAMLVVLAALSSVISKSASREVESQLQSSGAVYDRLWQQRSRELQNAAQLLARDFGFRAAVATGDQATMQSALGNAAARLKVRSAVIVTADGHISSYGLPLVLDSRAELWQPLDAGRLTGVSVLSGRPRQLVAAPIMAPTLIGWVVFVSDLERAILLLAYPKSEALADARKLQWALAALTFLGLLLVALATWRAAGRITQPLARLDEAAGRLASGEHVQVQVRGTDELARL